MKNNFVKSLWVATLILIVASCSKDDNNTEELTGSNDVSVKFDNGFAGNDLILGIANTPNENKEVLTINRFNYIVSNFRLVAKDGTEYTFPKDDSYFIINQETESDNIILHKIPAGEYTTIKFGVGVDQEKYLQGAEGQGDFLDRATENEMMWSWAAGYKFLNFEGTFTSETVTEPTNFQIHMGSLGSDLDLYKEVTLKLPTNVLVSHELSPGIHLMIDANKILVGAAGNISLSEKAVIMVDAVKSPQIAVNTSNMFAVDHVHNGAGSHE